MYPQNTKYSAKHLHSNKLGGCATLPYLGLQN
jgi:hypothetical protein